MSFIVPAILLFAIIISTGCFLIITLSETEESEQTHSPQVQYPIQYPVNEKTAYEGKSSLL